MSLSAKPMRLPNLDQTGVDLTDQVTVKFEHVLADLVTSFAAPMGNSMVIYGREGRIELPDPHYASKCFFIWGGWNAEGRIHRYDDAEGLYLRDRRDDPLRARKENGKSGCSACDDNCLRGAV